jgi:hypothetical protein
VIERYAFAMSDEVDVADFPPTVIQVEQPDTVTSAVTELPWERSIGLGALWKTALHVTVSAERVGATFVGQGVVRAALFAWLAELLAVGSMAVSLGLLLVAAFPARVSSALTDATFVVEVTRTVLGIVFGLATALVVLHWLWTWSSELGAWREGLPRRYRAGLALSAYSCGWDLVTSPFGVVALLFTRGWRDVIPALQAAVRAPRLCAVAHLEQARGFSVAQRHAVFKFAAWFTGPIVLLLSLALLVALVLAMA